MKPLRLLSRQEPCSASPKIATPDDVRGRVDDARPRTPRKVMKNDGISSAVSAKWKYGLPQPPLRYTAVIDSVTSMSPSQSTSAFSGDVDAASQRRQQHGPDQRHIECDGERLDEGADAADTARRRGFRAGSSSPARRAAPPATRPSAR